MGVYGAPTNHCEICNDETPNLYLCTIEYRGRLMMNVYACYWCKDHYAPRQPNPRNKKQRRPENTDSRNDNDLYWE